MTIEKCFECRNEIDTENFIYYVFICKSKEGNEAFCTECYLQDVADMNELDPSLTAIYVKNFIRMNK